MSWGKKIGLIENEEYFLKYTQNGLKTSVRAKKRKKMK